jgi:hypothetical protein
MKRVLIVLLLVSGGPLLAQSLRPREVTAWRADVRFLARQVPARHPAPFLRITRAQWDSAAASLEHRLPMLRRNQVLVGILQLVALPGDAHTGVEPDPSLGLRYYPLELYSFDDGLFVRRADPGHADLVGARVLQIGDAPVADAFTRVGTIIPH